MQKLRRICPLTTGWTPPSGDNASYEGDNPWANISDLGDRVLTSPVKCISDEAVARSRIPVSPEGSLLFSFKLSIGQVSFAGRDMYTNEAIATFRPSERLDLGFAYYSFPFCLVKNANENIYGAKLLNQEQMYSARIPLPPLDEQRRVAAFLDCETAKIDALIAKQEQLIATLREDRTATITHAVTKGLDAGVEMKKADVEWLDLIPSHWNQSLVKYACTMLSGYPFKSEGFSHDHADIRLLRGANVGVDRIEWDDVVYWPKTDAAALTEYALGPGDIVMGLDRPFISTGIRVSRVGHEDVPSLLLQRVLRLRATSDFDQDFLSYVLAGPGIVHHLTPMFTGVSVPHVSPNQVGSLPLPQPPLAEQRRIVNYLDGRCDQLDAVIRKTQEVISILGEYRSALITDAVTGKIDVREVVA